MYNVNSPWFIYYGILQKTQFLSSLFPPMGPAWVSSRVS